MKNKNFVRLTFCFIILILIFFIIYGVIHEIAHYGACRIVGSDGKITISLLRYKPIFKVSCFEINEKSSFSKFLYWGSPYIVSLSLLVWFLFLYKKSLYLISIPVAIILSDLFNLLGFFKWGFNHGEIGNDLFQIAFRLPIVYSILLIVIIGFSVSIFVLIINGFIKKLMKFRK